MSGVVVRRVNSVEEHGQEGDMKRFSEGLNIQDARIEVK